MPRVPTPEPEPEPEPVMTAEEKKRVENILTSQGDGSIQVKAYDFNSSGMSASVIEKIKARKQRETDQINLARANFLMEQKKKADDQVKRDEVKARLTAKLTAWAGDPSKGTLKNIRALLSNMHTILWEGNNWKPVGIADMVQASKVKRIYYKALRIAHPDRSANASVEQQYTAGFILDMLKLAWTKFQQVEGG